MPDFQVATDNGVLTYRSEEVKNTSKLLPLVIMLVDYTDPFLAYMVNDPVSMFDFLSLDPIPDANFLFLFKTNVGQNMLQASINFQLDRLCAETQTLWRSHIYLATRTMEDMRKSSELSAVLVDVLDSFKSIRKFLAFWSESSDKQITSERLDCNFQWAAVQGPDNHSPKNPLSSELVYVPNPCKITHGDFNNSFALIYDDKLGCSKEDAIRHMAERLTNLTGVIVMARQNTQLQVIGEKEYAEGVPGPNATIIASMIPYQDELLEKVRQGNVSILFFYKSEAPGNFVAIDARGKMQEIGYAINPWLRTIGWSAQYWSYREALQLSSSQPADSVTIMQDLVAQGTQPVDLTAFFPLGDKVTTALYIDATLSCAGVWNMDCPIWDHVATLTVQCSSGTVENNFGPAEPGGSFSELARYITPYRLRVGQWSTDVTDLAPLLQMKDCTFNVTMPAWGTDSWIWSFSLRARRPKTPPSCSHCVAGLPWKGEKLFSNNEPMLRQTFNASYNTNRDQQISIPAGTRWAHLIAIITGHGEDETGCCEFLPSRHVFTLNDEEFAVEFMEPLSNFKCTKPSEGVEPNAYGGWWMGRNGWCNGQDVKPWVIDVTSAVLSSQGPLQAKYQGLSWNKTSNEWVQPHATSGYILMSSHLSFYN